MRNPVWIKVQYFVPPDDGSGEIKRSASGEAMALVPEDDIFGERLVECYNACVGLNPDAIPDVVSALTEIVNEHPDPSNHKGIERARAALAELRGEPNERT